MNSSKTDDYITVSIHTISKAKGIKIDDIIFETLKNKFGIEIEPDDFVQFRITEILKGDEVIPTKIRKYKTVNKWGGPRGSITFRKKFAENMGLVDGVEINVVFENLVKSNKK